MPLDPRPSPQEVASLLAGGLTDGEIADALHVLRRDPNWHIRAISSPTAWDLTLIYHPAGGPTLTLRLEQRETDTGARIWCKIP